MIVLVTVNAHHFPQLIFILMAIFLEAIKQGIQVINLLGPHELLLIDADSIDNSRLILLNDCTCSMAGHTLTYECVVVGGGTTVWQGSALNCLSDTRFLLRHSQFDSGITDKECNNGSIVARSVRVVDDSYISQLNVTVRPEMNNKTVECLYDDGTMTALIGISTVTITTGTVVNSHNECSY